MKRIPLQDVAVINQGDKQQLIIELTKMQEAFTKMIKVCENLRRRIKNE